MKFKVGDRVKCFGYNYGGARHDGDKGTVIALGSDGDVTVHLDKGPTRDFHPRCLRRLKPKAKPREFWIPKVYCEDELKWLAKDGLKHMADKPDEEVIEQYIRVREVRNDSHSTQKASIQKEKV